MLNPSKQLYPWTPFIKDQFTKESAGTYYVLNDEFESVLNVFILKTEYSETIIGGFIQPPITDMQTFAESVNNQRSAEGMLEINTNLYDTNINLFNDINEILKVKNWVDRIT